MNFSIKVSSYGRALRITKVIVGETYVYRPQNPRAPKNRDRMCKLLSYYYDPKKEGATKNAEVQWSDTSRTSQIDASSLVSVSDAQRCPQELEQEAVEFLYRHIS